MAFFKGFPVDGSSARVASSSAGGPISIAFGASTGGKRWHLDMAAWSVDAAPSFTPLSVYDGTSSGPLIFQITVGSSGHDAIRLPPLRGSANTAMSVVLSSASTGWMHLNAFAYLDD